MRIHRPTKHQLETCECIEITAPHKWQPNEETEDDISEEDYFTLIDACQDNRRLARTRHTQRHEVDPEKYRAYLLYPGKEVLKKTFECTTRYGTINTRIPLRQHLKSRNPLLQRRRLLEPYATDTWFSVVTSYEGHNCAQIFTGIKSTHTRHYGMARETQGPDTLLEFFRQEGVPLSIRRDNSKMQVSHLWQECC